MDFNFIRLLQKVTTFLASFLNKVLPNISDDWWNQKVINTLSSQQQLRIAQQKITALTSLDFAALLRILDQNWYEISSRENFASETRHFVKEMQTIRNRWSHVGSEGFPIEDVYRDLDTLYRFAKVINADENFLQEIQNEKANLLSKNNSGGKLSTHPGPESEPIKNQQTAEFEVGQLVSLRSNISMQGAIIQVLPGNPENRYQVFVNNEIQTYYASQLILPTRSNDNLIVFPAAKFHAYLTALQIRYPALSTLYSLNAARISFIPYQFRPVLRFIRSDRPRLLIADGVGVGKTIEAGLILREMQARREIQSILIICPRPMVVERKWQIEMKRFDERFTPLDGRTLRYCINEMDLDGVWPEKYQRVIIPYSQFDETLLSGTAAGKKGKHKKGLLELDPPPRFDLVIVDEAHHLRNQDTFSHKAVRFFCDHAEAVLFLTATPIQLGNHDLFVLLNMLRPDIIIDLKSFEHIAAPNPFINHAVALMRSQKSGWENQVIEALDQAAATGWGQSILKRHPEFIRIRSRIHSGNVSVPERIELINDIESLHTFAGIINRTRRCDIGDFTIRKPQTIVVEFTPSQKQLHDELLQIQAEIFSQLHGNQNIHFMLTTFRRQAASCLFGLAPLLEDILRRHLDELFWEEIDETATLSNETSVDSIETRIQMILEKAGSLDAHDPKLEALHKIIREKQGLPNNKLMLFSSFRHTLNYLFGKLQADGIRIGLVHGGTPDEARVELRQRFEKSREEPESLDMLLFSEIGSEGLDYQFCDCIVNYDLPWNPMRIEQRIGRIDRQGQKSETVAIYNFITPGTVDADIYFRCLERIGVFNRALGDSEQILGEVTREIRNIAENFSLSETERGQKLQQLADNQIRFVQEQEQLEQRQMELFGIHLPQEQLKKEIENASSFWLAPVSIFRLVALYLQHSCEKDQEFILGEKPLKTLRLSQDARSNLLRDFQQLHRQNSTAYREWENWLKGGNPHLPITFDADCATQHHEAAFIMPLHPLVKQAAMAFKKLPRVVTLLSAESDDVPAGRYNFAIYQWQFQGIREDLVFQPIAATAAMTAQLPRLLEKAVDAKADAPTNNDEKVWQELETQHYTLWSDAREKHRQRTRELVAYRKESLSTSHRARMALLREQLEQATNEKIQRMRQSQIAAAEADYARRIQDLGIAAERAEVVAEVVVVGILFLNLGLNNG